MVSNAAFRQKKSLQIGHLEAEILTEAPWLQSKTQTFYNVVIYDILISMVANSNTK